MHPEDRNGKVTARKSGKVNNYVANALKKVVSLLMKEHLNGCNGLH